MFGLEVFLKGRTLPPPSTQGNDWRLLEVFFKDVIKCRHPHHLLQYTCIPKNFSSSSLEYTAASSF
jgi:hypothetical protein